MNDKMVFNLEKEITEHDASVVLESFRVAFGMAYLVDPEEKCIYGFDDDGHLVKTAPCSSVWGGDGKCERCNPKLALTENRRIDEYEEYDGDVYHTMSKPINVNGHRLVIRTAYKDDEVKREIESKKIVERDMSVIAGLSENFTFVVYVDKTTGKEIHYRMDPVFEKYIPGWTDIFDFRTHIQRITEVMVHPDDKKSFIAATAEDVVKTKLAEDSIYYVKFRIQAENDVVYYQLKFANDTQNPNSFIAGFRNIDMETRHEMETLQMAESATNAKHTFLFNMSHDIRTPMNAITGYTVLARNHINDSERVNDYLDKIDISGQHLLKLINEVLDMSSIESGKVSIDEKPVDIRDKANEVIEMCQKTATEKGITLSLNTDDVETPKVYADELHVNQILTNILSNAMKFTPEGGRVTYSISQTPTNVPGYITYNFVIEDTGIGMSKDFVGKIFDSFSRERSVTVSGIEGTGLGMAIVKKLVDLLDGTIEIESEQGKGTKVTVKLPFKVYYDEIEAKAVEAPKNSVEFTGKRVLIVEDNMMNREIASEIMEEEGFEVETAEDGDDAVEMVKNSAPGYYDFILMDVQMPRMNGYDATKAIRELDSEVSKVPIIAMTANALAEDRKNAFQAGMDDHLAKPIDIKALFETVAKYIK